MYIRKIVYMSDILLEFWMRREENQEKAVFAEKIVDESHQATDS